jgi:hypothetical protein
VGSSIALEKATELKDFYAAAYEKLKGDWEEATKNFRKE